LNPEATMSELTPRFGLPFIFPGQAQKELFHNEALLRIDAALSAAAEGAPRADPPTNPAEGEAWIVAQGALGEWSGNGDKIACWTGGGWRFVAPAAGMIVWNKAAGVPMQWSGSGWSQGRLACAGLTVAGHPILAERQPAVASPSGGTIIDEQARAAVNSLIATLKSHGLID
jgi:hypothetical protein